MRPDTVPELLAWQAPARHDIIGLGVLPKEQVMFIYGDEGTYKSWLMLRLAWCVAEGTRWMGLPTTASRVLLLNTEIPKTEYQRRVRQFAKWRQCEPRALWLVTDLTRKLDSSAGIIETANEIKEAQADLLIVDDLYRAMSGELSKEPDAKKLIENLDRLRSATGVGIVLVHHTHKPSDDRNGSPIDNGTSEMYGHSFLKDYASTIIRVRRTQDGITLSTQKANLADFTIPLSRWAMSATMDFIPNIEFGTLVQRRTSDSATAPY